ncbi:MAG: HAMP domain-containing histidine kinase, partial [Kordiimonadaceae bacterium]|nr:HAMP domain-containing histidine kinase [Kordiimonadaceae bacterium]
LLAEEAEHNKISLQELEEAEQNSTDLNEDVTANILEVLRASKNNKSADIHGAGQELLELIDSLLELKELETTEFELHEENFDLIDILKDSINKYKDEALKKNVTVEVSYILNFPEIYGDRPRLLKAFECIIDNAVKFTQPEGKISVSLAKDQAGNCVICCKDNGKGMTPHEITKAFSSDTQLDDIYSDPCTGIGFGISYVKKLLEKHSGSLSIISAPGEGTIINLNLPKDRLITPSE